jgi:hypothetical protein
MKRVGMFLLYVGGIRHSCCLTSTFALSHDRDFQSGCGNNFPEVESLFSVPCLLGWLGFSCLKPGIAIACY